MAQDLSEVGELIRAARHPCRVASFPSLRGTATAPWALFPQSQDATAAGLGLLTGFPTRIN
jgi:hypothetical protein